MLFCYFLNNKKILVDEQNGFRKERSCIDHIFVLHSVVNNRINQKLETFSAFLDLKKAFDSVQRDFLLYKLNNIGIDGKMYFSIKSLYENTKACVRVNQEFTSLFATPSGVRQGDTLLPTLFSIYINDLFYEVDRLNCGVKIDGRHVSILFYADDIVLLSESAQNLQIMLTAVNSWCNRLLFINHHKSKIIHFRKTRSSRSNFILKIGEDILDYTSSYKYLGVYFNEFLKFNVNKESLALSGTRALGNLISKYKNNKHMTYSVFNRLFSSCVIPVLDYGAEVWGIYNCSELERVQVSAARTFLGLNRYTPILGIEGDIGWDSCQLRVNILILKYWNRMLKKDDSTLCKHVFKWDYDMNTNNWSSYVNSLFDLCNLDNFENQTTCLIELCYEKLCDIENINWYQKLNFKPKLRTYKLLKNNKITERYVKFNLDCKERSMLAQLRMGTLALHVETGRYRNLPLNRRFCFHCLDQIEDEIHFVFDCTLYTEYRLELFSYVHNLGRDLSNLSCYVKLILLFHEFPRQFAKYICKSFTKRKYLLHDMNLI